MNQQNKVIDVVGVGSPMIDFFIHTNVCRGSSKEGLGFRFPSEDSKGKWLNLISEETKVSAGGSVTNTLMGLAALNMKTAFIGQLGNDEFSDLFFRLISDFAIDTTELNICPERDSTTGLCFVYLSENGENYMSTFPGNSLEFSLSSSMIDMIKAARVVYVEGYLWNSEKGRNLCKEIGKICTDHDIVVALNLSDKHTAQNHAKSLRDYINQFVSILFGNFDEFVACYGESDIHNKLDELSGASRIICMTLNKEGAILFSQKSHFKSPAHPTTCLNSTGAGDLFVSGFLASYLNKISLEKAVKYGTLVASNIISVCPSEKVSSIRALKK